MGTVHSGPKNPNWRGGRSVASSGYVLIRVGVGHPLADVRGYAYEHRLVAERKLGRPLAKGEHVHHVDGNKRNNAPANLEVLTVAEHRAEHRVPRKAALRLPGEPNPEIACGCGCGEQFKRYDGSGRPRRFLPGHNGHEAARQEAVLDILKGGPLTVADLVRLSGGKKRAVAVALQRLKARGVVAQVARGHWVRTTSLPGAEEVDVGIARAIADALLEVGFPVTAQSAPKVAETLRRLASAYETSFSGSEAA